ncbi:MAG: hypothetical protein NDI69_09170 [Bacteriovoracaceae bacterium]|nr:hypothetical protein [Bacteriovoracaceae bacterium]
MRILLIEEENFVFSFLASKLKDGFHCHVDQVKHSQKGLRLLKTEKPYDFIIADYQTPASLGVELREFHVRHSIPGRFVFYTNIQCFDSGLLSHSACVVSRLTYENLYQFILNNY